jgi:hypothetical protein
MADSVASTWKRISQHHGTAQQAEKYDLDQPLSVCVNMYCKNTHNINKP